jgi:hypothetical protein
MTAFWLYFGCGFNLRMGLGASVRNLGGVRMWVVMGGRAASGRGRMRISEWWSRSLVLRHQLSIVWKIVTVLINNRSVPPI